MLFETEIISKELINLMKERKYKDTRLDIGYIAGIAYSIKKINELVDKELEDMFKDYLKNERGCELWGTYQEHTNTPAAYVT